MTAARGYSDYRLDAFTYIGPAVIRVPDDYAKIQTALNFAESGDTVLVSAGTYNEYNIDYGEESLRPD